MSIAEKEKCWYALYTKPRWEKKISALLEKKQLEYWCPLQKKVRQWSDRKKLVEEPVFKSYVFVKISQQERLAVLQTEGVLNFVYYLGKPAVIREEEINIIKAYLLQKDVSIQVQSAESFEKDTHIRIRQGIFMDREGKVIRTAGKNKVYVSLESLGQVMIVAFPADHVETLPR